MDPDQGTVVGPDGESGSGEAEVPGLPGYMVLDCTPTFRTDAVCWGYAKLIDGEWVEQEYNGCWQPEYPHVAPDGNRYELQPGHYKLINIISDEFALPKFNHGGYDLKHDEIEFDIKSGEDTPVSLVFGDYARRPVMFKVKYDGDRGIKNIVVTLHLEKETCKVTEYKRETNNYRSDWETSELVYYFNGVPMVTDSIRFTVYYTNNTSKSAEFSFTPSSDTTVKLDLSGK